MASLGHIMVLIAIIALLIAITMLHGQDYMQLSRVKGCPPQPTHASDALRPKPG